MKIAPTYIYGRHAVVEALKNAPHIVSDVMIAPGPHDELRALLQRTKIPYTELNLRKLPPEVDQEAVHQGAMARIYPEKLVQSYTTFIQNLDVTQDTAIVILGEIQDPQNVGAIIRSAAAFGVTAVFLPERHQAPITSAVVKISAGMAFKIPLVQIGNVNMAVRDLKERGVWVYGLAGDEQGTLLSDEKFDAPTAIVIGNEAKGIREKTREHCDVLLKIPMSPDCESLNAATSGAIALYAWSVKHPAALEKLRELPKLKAGSLSASQAATQSGAQARFELKRAADAKLTAEAPREIELE